MNGNRTTSKTGFTIVELLIVIVVIAILAAISIVAYNGIQARARDSIRSSDIASIKKAMEIYIIDNSVYPDGCGGTGGCNLSNLSTFLTPNYIASIPSEPKTGQTYSYVRNAAGNGYGIRITYETKPECKTGVNVMAGWWGTGVPIC